jgi:hypothetical protein
MLLDADHVEIQLFLTAILALSQAAYLRLHGAKQRYDFGRGCGALVDPRHHAFDVGDHVVRFLGPPQKQSARRVICAPA